MKGTFELPQLVFISEKVKGEKIMQDYNLDFAEPLCWKFILYVF